MHLLVISHKNKLIISASAPHIRTFKTPKSNPGSGNECKLQIPLGGCNLCLIPLIALAPHKCGCVEVKSFSILTADRNSFSCVKLRIFGSVNFFINVTLLRSHLRIDRICQNLMEFLYAFHRMWVEDNNSNQNISSIFFLFAVKLIKALPVRLECTH